MIRVLDQDFTLLNQYIEKTKPSQIFILCDENTHENCVATLLANLKTETVPEIIEIEAGEEMKTIETATQLWEILSEFEADRKSLLLNLGGGVITDMGGFVASTYKRGIRFVNIPTTLLAMCDASIGGKTGIDHQFLKNIVGTFALPEGIFVYPPYLSTLPFEELRSGFAEMLKHGLIADKKHWEDLISIEDLDSKVVAPYIERSMQIKQSVVDEDFKEQNVRKILNFGHTVGHALESLFLKNNVGIPHGEAVALGMICETHLAFLEGLIDQSTAYEVINHLQRFYPYHSIEAFSDDEILALMKNDKKNASGQISFSLIDRIGNCKYDYKAENKHIKSALAYYRSL